MINVLVTSVGSVISHGIISSIRASKYDCRIIGVDIYEDAVGRYFVDRFEKGVLAIDSGFPNFIRDIIVENKVDIVFLGMEVEINIIAQNISYFSDLDTKFVLNSLSLIETANDKWMLHNELVRNNFDVITTYINGRYCDISQDIGVPMLLKPRCSSGSKGIHRINDEDDFNYWKNKLQRDFMVQEIVGQDSEEYTSSVFGLSNGGYVNCITFLRKLNGDGTTVKAKVVNDASLNALISELTAVFQPIGPTNYQFRKKGANYLLLEINPRISSSTSMRMAFGVNEAEMCIDYFLFKQVPKEKQIALGRAMRYYKDYIIYENCCTV